MEEIENKSNQEGTIKMRPDEAAIYIGCAEYTIRKMVREKQIPHYRIGVKILFTRNSLDKWVLEQESKCVGRK